jgi:hypothetical protein
LLLAFGGWVQADTVVLTDGGRVSGRVTSTPRSVTVESSGGILTLPAWRVARVEKEGQVVEPTRAPESAAPVAPASEGAKPAAQKAGAASLQEVLNRKIDVDFEGMPLPDALAYVRELTGMNMAISPGVRTATTPVYLHLKGIRVKAVLDLVVEAGNFRYAVRQGDIVWVSEGLPPGALSSRAYDATDLLLSKEDLFSPTIGGTAGATGGAGTGGGRAAGGGVNPQFSPGRSGGGGIQTGGSPGQGVSYGAPASARAGTLILLIKGTCGPETWMYPASPGVLSAGGPAAGANVARNPGF